MALVETYWGIQKDYMPDSQSLKHMLPPVSEVCSAQLAVSETTGTTPFLKKTKIHRGAQMSRIGCATSFLCVSRKFGSIPQSKIIPVKTSLFKAR